MWIPTGNIYIYNSFHMQKVYRWICWLHYLMSPPCWQLIKIIKMTFEIYSFLMTWSFVCLMLKAEQTPKQAHRKLTFLSLFTRFKWTLLVIKMLYKSQDYQKTITELLSVDVCHLKNLYIYKGRPYLPILHIGK